MNNEELIKQIAKNSRKIVDEADAQKITTEDEVEQIVIDLLTRKDTFTEIVKEANSYAQYLNNLYNKRVYCKSDYERIIIHAQVDPDLSILVEDAADYGPLDCLATDGPDEIYPDVKTAVKCGLIENFGNAILNAAEKEYKRLHDEQEDV